jgi:hypothetical protein
VLPAALPAPPHPKTLRHLEAAFAAEEARDNDDLVVPLRELRLTEAGMLNAPDLGELAFTDWSRGQCAGLLGLRWDRFFENADASVRASELNGRLARADRSVKLRTRKPAGPGEPVVLRAIVSTGYVPIRDSVVAGLLSQALAPVEPEQRLVRSGQTDMTTSYVVKVGEAFRPGGSVDVGDVWGAVTIRNSGVGHSALAIVASLVRLICRNGMHVPLGDGVLLRRSHRGVTEEKLRELLAGRLDALPGRLAEGAEVLRRARDRVVHGVKAAVSLILERAHLPKKLVDDIMAAYDLEPHPSPFGVAQALTRYAQRASQELRFELERAAGRYLASFRDDLH